MQENIMLLYSRWCQCERSVKTVIYCPWGISEKRELDYKKYNEETKARVLELIGHIFGEFSRNRNNDMTDNFIITILFHLVTLWPVAITNFALY